MQQTARATKASRGLLRRRDGGARVSPPPFPRLRSRPAFFSPFPSPTLSLFLTRSISLSLALWLRRATGGEKTPGALSQVNARTVHLDDERREKRVRRRVLQSRNGGPEGRSSVTLTTVLG